MTMRNGRDRGRRKLSFEKWRTLPRDEQCAQFRYMSEENWEPGVRCLLSQHWVPLDWLDEFNQLPVDAKSMFYQILMDAMSSQRAKPAPKLAIPVRYELSWN